MEKEVREKLHEILDLVLDRNEKGKTTFFYFSGHVNSVTVDAYDGEWEPDGVSATLYSFLGPESKKNLERIAKQLC